MRVTQDVFMDDSDNDAVAEQSLARDRARPSRAGKKIRSLGTPTASPEPRNVPSNIPEPMPAAATNPEIPEVIFSCFGTFGQSF